jgi:hypothetical protein
MEQADAQGEWAYDRKWPIGKLDNGRDEEIAKGWTVVDVEEDWLVAF